MNEKDILVVAKSYYVAKIIYKKLTDQIPIKFIHQLNAKSCSLIDGTTIIPKPENSIIFAGGFKFDIVFVHASVSIPFMLGILPRVTNKKSNIIFISHYNDPKLKLNTIIGKRIRPYHLTGLDKNNKDFDF